MHLKSLTQGINILRNIYKLFIIRMSKVAEDVDMVIPR